MERQPQSECPHLSFCLRLQAADWTEDELSLLSRLMVKFPGGTPGRWEKIAHELGRSVTDVSQSELVQSEQDWMSSTSNTSCLCARLG